MDTLISGFAEESRINDVIAEPTNPNRPDNSVITNVGSFTNKLSKFTLATFDDQGINFFTFIINSISIKKTYCRL